MSRHGSLKMAALGGLVGLLLVVSPVAAGSTAGVKIGEANNKYRFEPTTAYVNVGGAVTWTNGSDAPHTVTSDSGSDLASSNIGASKTYSHTFAATGTFAYHCTIHDYMVGKVIVLAAGVTPPATDAIAANPAPTSQGGGALLLAVIGLLGALIGLRRFRRAR